VYIGPAASYAVCNDNRDGTSVLLEVTYHYYNVSLPLTVSDSYLKLVCLQSTSAYSALEVLHFMRYINLLTYLH